MTVDQTKKVFITGLNVAVQYRNNICYGATPHWDIMELFYQNLSSFNFGAVQIFGGAGRSEYDLPLGDSHKLVLLNERPYLRTGRIIETPRIYARLFQAISASDYVYIRFPSWVGLAAWRCANWLKKPYWVSIHGDWSHILQTYVQNANSSLSHLYYSINQKQVELSLIKILGSASCVFFVGKALYDKFHFHTSHSVVYEDVVHNSEDVWQPRRVIHSNHITLLFIGEVTIAKGVDVLLQAIEHIARKGTQIHLIVAGRGPETEKLLGQTIQGVKIDYRGWVSHGESFDNLFREADALVLPSRTEGVPRVIIEAMVHALPVIATNVGSISELLGSGSRGWLVSVGNASELAEAIIDLQSNEEKRLLKIEEGISYVRTHDRTYWTNVIGKNLRQIDPGLVI